MVKPRRKECTLLMSCRCIIGQEDDLPLRTGAYGNGSLVVVSEQGDEQLVKVPEIRDLLWDKEVVAAFVYLAGISLSLDTPKKEHEFEATRALLKIAIGHTEKERIHLVGCSCNPFGGVFVQLGEERDFCEGNGTRTHPIRMRWQ